MQSSTCLLLLLHRPVTGRADHRYLTKHRVSIGLQGCQVQVNKKCQTTWKKMPNRLKKCQTSWNRLNAVGFDITRSVIWRSGAPH